MPSIKENVFITGGTGYIGKRLIKALLAEGRYSINVLVRKESENKVPEGCNIVIGNALDAETFKEMIPSNAVFIHLVGVSHPSPFKKGKFKSIDLISVEQAKKAALFAKSKHFIYLSVTQFHSWIIKDYQQARKSGERILTKSGIPCTFLRPWYVLGPGHWWPIIFQPLIYLAKLNSFWKRLVEEREFISIRQMIAALTLSVKTTPMYVMVMEIADMKRL